MWYGIFICQLLAKVDVLKDMLLFRGDPNQCTGLFDTDEIGVFVLSDFHVCLSVCLSVCLLLLLFSCCTLSTISIIIVIIVVIAITYLN